jgi:DNA-binding transcriptional LysR family regulator
MPLCALADRSRSPKNDLAGAEASTREEWRAADGPRKRTSRAWGRAPRKRQGNVMQIETLKVFCDLVESRSFSQAAARNFVTQSAVSQQVKALESRFGTLLLVRESRSAAPTEAGRILYEGARQILDSFARMEAELHSAGSEISGSVRVATVYSVGLYEMSSGIKEFLKRYPRVNLHVEYSRPNRVYEGCLTGAIDLGVVAYPKARRGLEVLPLPSDRLVLICAPEHPFAGKRRIEIGQLHGQNFIAFEKDIPSRVALDRIFHKHRVAVRVVMEFDNIETIKRSVEIGAGVSIVPLLSVQREVQAGTLAQVEFRRQNFVRPLGILVRRSRPLSPAAAKFIELLES